MLRKPKRRGGDVQRAYTLKEAFRAILPGDLTPDDAGQLIDRWVSRASRSRLPALALVMLTCGPITLRLPHEQPRIRTG